jgi:hypothetical protein
MTSGDCGWAKAKWRLMAPLTKHHMADLFLTEYGPRKAIYTWRESRTNVTAVAWFTQCTEAIDNHPVAAHV